jgi:chaperonin GroEL
MAAIQRPFATILSNAGYDAHKIHDIADEIVKSDNFWYGYNLRSEAYVDMFEEGIIDPAKVTRLALENASSIARTMLTTECVISNVKEDKKQEMDFNQFM